MPNFGKKYTKETFAKAPFTVDAHGARWPTDLLGPALPVPSLEIAIAQRWLDCCTTASLSANAARSDALAQRVQQWAHTERQKGLLAIADTQTVSAGAVVRAALVAGYYVRAHNDRAACEIWLECPADATTSPVIVQHPPHPKRVRSKPQTPPIPLLNEWGRPQKSTYNWGGDFIEIPSAKKT